MCAYIEKGVSNIESDHPTASNQHRYFFTRTRSIYVKNEELNVENRYIENRK